MGTGAVQVRPWLASTFGPYELVQRIGRGGMGEVYLAICRARGSSELVVVKRLHPHLFDDEQYVRMFLDEARIATRLDHPNVVRTFDVGDVDRFHYLTMEYLSGHGLDRVLKAGRAAGEPIPPRVLARVISDCLAGLHYAHELRDFTGAPLSLVHRDISPGNVFVSYDGSTKLLDFGVAKTNIQQVQTRAGTIKGKVAYMSPQHVTGELIDRRTDLWSIAVVLYEGLCGASPFQGSSDLDRVHRIVEAARTLAGCSLPAQVAQSPEARELLHVAMGGLRPSPADRFPTAGVMRSRVESFLQRYPASGADVAAYLSRVFPGERAAQEARVADFLNTGSRQAPLDESEPPTKVVNYLKSGPRPSVPGTRRKLFAGGGVAGNLSLLFGVAIAVGLLLFGVAIAVGYWLFEATPLG